MNPKQNLIILQRPDKKSDDYSKVMADYLKEVEEEYNQLKPFLPSEIKNVLDIGCGMGGIDIFLYRDYKPKITFLDRNGIDNEVKYGYHKTSSKYCLLSETKKFVESHGVLGAKYVNIDEEPFPTEEFDLTISLFSMGFHYPLQTYKPKTKYLIFDTRKGLPMPETSQIIHNRRGSVRILCKNN